jgi:outer membrane protein assembly factor BamE (lipoprotein component of BamABCDE complex)
LSVFLALLTLFLAGCASARRGIGDNLTVPKIIEIVPGETTRAQVRTIFGKPDVVKELSDGSLEYAYIQGRNDSVSWLILSGYLVYHPTTAFSGSRILVVCFEGEKVSRYVATDGIQMLKKGYSKEEEEPSRREGK